MAGTPPTTRLSDLFSTDRGLLAGALLAFALLLAQWFVLLVNFVDLPPELPIYFSLPTGTDQLAYRWWVFLIPGFSSLSVFAGLLIIRLTLSMLRVFHHLVLWLSVLIVLLGLVSVGHVLWLVL